MPHQHQDGMCNVEGLPSMTLGFTAYDLLDEGWLMPIFFPSSDTWIYFHFLSLLSVSKGKKSIMKWHLLCTFYLSLLWEKQHHLDSLTLQKFLGWVICLNGIALRTHNTFFKESFTYLCYCSLSASQKHCEIFRKTLPNASLASFRSASSCIFFNLSASACFCSLVNSLDSSFWNYSHVLRSH